jgi:L,D-peptidoglycan transpeptidase YkuD (ErfK/YbiS/YcfS/YnhG family)
MDLVVDGDGCAAWGAHVFRAALGRAGITRRKREGDQATPQGEFLLREVLYRADRVAIPRTRLPFRALKPEDGWCDAAKDPRYNRRVRLPYSASAERLWREDHLYDLLTPLGYNDDPVVPGLGSAIFLHVAWPNYLGTEGCIALALEDLLTVLEEADARSRVVVRD